MRDPALWIAVAGCLVAVAAVVAALIALGRARLAESIAIGHALDRSWHPAAPGPAVRLTRADKPDIQG